MAVAPELTVRPVTAADEGAVSAFIVAHPLHGPGHRRELGAVERALGHREYSVAAWRDGAVVGYAPAWWVPQRTLRVIRSGRLAGGGLVACGPLAGSGLPASEQRAVIGALVSAVRAAGSRLGARSIGWTLPGFVGAAGGFGAAETQLIDDVVAAGCSAQLRGGLLTDLAGPEAALWQSLHGNTRRAIRKAESSGVVATLPDGAQAAAQLRGFRAQATTAFGGSPRAASALEALAEVFEPAAAAGPLYVCIATDVNGEALSAVVTVESQDQGYYLLALNTGTGLARDGNRVALWRAMLAGRTRGVRRFLLGSLDYGSGKSAQISAFKRRFGGAAVFAPTATMALSPALEARDQLLTAAAARLRGR